MRFNFHTKKLKDLYTEEKGARKYPPEVADSFFEAIAIIAAAKDVRDLYALKGLRFEKLSGNRKGDRSIRLTKQWRLILKLEKDQQGNYLIILDIEKHYQR